MTPTRVGGRSRSFYLYVAGAREDSLRRIEPGLGAEEEEASTRRDRVKKQSSLDFLLYIVEYVR